MKGPVLLLSSLAVCVAVLLCPCARGGELLLEAESLAELGGWVVDQQFIDVMGSTYLLAHGLGKPCPPAKGQVTLPHSGRYRVWVRTKDWVAEPQYAPGRFRVKLNGKPLAATFGTQGDGQWIWQDGGTIEIAKEVTVELEDLTGFDGRCDAIYFTTDPAAIPPAKPGAEMTAWREKLRGLNQPPRLAGQFDAVVVGGGIAGCSAAITAARLGCKVALIQNRPVLGGNNSPEIRVHTGPWGLPGKLVSPEIAGDYGHKTTDVTWWDPATSPVEAAERKRQKVVDAEKNLTQFLGWHVFRAQKTGDRIASVDAQNVRSGEELRFAAAVFIDCTGDGWVGYHAGATFRHGQEARSEHNEPLAPEKAVKMTLGSTLMWYSKYAAAPVAFGEAAADATSPAGGSGSSGSSLAADSGVKTSSLAGASGLDPVPWATAISKGRAATHGDWQWEYGHYRDTIWEAEEIRDYLLRAIYGAFSTAKRKGAATNARLELHRVNYIAGKRESRRLMGDYVLTQADCWDNREKPDRVALGDNPFDLHVPSESHDFIIRVHPGISLKDRRRFDIPFRCLYSCNVSNLLMAGRCISATRIAHSAIRIQNTGGQTGVAVGAAAFLCKKHGELPRGICQQHLRELQDIVFAQDLYRDALQARKQP